RSSIVLIASGDYYNRKVLINQGCRSVLSLSRRISFGVNVRNLFQFQRTIHGHRIMNRPPQKKKIFVLPKTIGELFTLLHTLQDRLGFFRKIKEFFYPGSKDLREISSLTSAK